MKTWTIFPVAIGAIACQICLADDAPQLKARELFYNPVLPKAAAAQPSKPVPDSHTPKPRHPKTPKPSTTTTSTESPKPPIIPATLESSAPKALALRYSVSRLNAGGSYVETDVDSTFHTGDAFRITAEANEDGYLYIVQQGTSKNWEVLFPSPDINGGNNEVKAHTKIVLPSGAARFTVVGDPGEERVFLVLSRHRLNDLDTLIYSLQKPSTPVTPAPVKGFTLAQNRTVDSGAFNDIRAQLGTRDLVLEKVDDESGLDERAVYAASVDASPEARVVSNLSLKHE